MQQKEPYYNKGMQKLINKKVKNMKNISVWYDQYGTDEKYFEIEGEYNKNILKEISKNVSFCEGVNFEDFEAEEEGEGWVMYGYDGIGIFVVEEGYDSDKCKEEYDSLCD